MPKTTKRKTFNIDADVAYALETYSRESGARINELANEALSALLRKRHQPITVAEALRESVRSIPANDRSPPTKPKRRKRKS